MAGKEFVILYTHQKTKKSKTWHDGVLKLSDHGNRAVLYDDNKTCLDALHLKPDQVQSLLGEQLESDKYLITVEEEKTSTSSAASTSSDSENTNPVCNVRPQQPVYSNQCTNSMQRLPLRQPLKRRRTGFTVPRQVIKNPASDPGLVAQSSITDNRAAQSAPPQSSKPSLFNTPFSNNTSNSHKSFFNLYGSNSSNKQVVSSQPNFPPHAVNSSPNGNNVPVNSSLNRGDQFCTESSSPGNRSEESLEDSFEPQCFDATTPNVTRSNSDTSQFTEFKIDDVQESQDSVDFDLDHKALVVENQLDQINNQESDPPVQNQSNETGAGKRSASQILALLGRGKVKFKPPMKESVSSVVPGSRLQALTQRQPSDGGSLDVKQCGNLSSKTSTAQKPLSLPTGSRVNQSNISFNRSREFGSNYTGDSTVQMNDGNGSSSAHQRSAGGSLAGASNQNIQNYGHRRQQGVASSVESCPTDQNKPRQCHRQGVGSGWRTDATSGLNQGKENDSSTSSKRSSGHTDEENTAECHTCTLETDYDDSSRISGHGSERKVDLDTKGTEKELKRDTSMISPSMTQSLSVSQNDSEGNEYSGSESAIKECSGNDTSKGTPPITQPLSVSVSERKVDLDSEGMYKELKGDTSMVTPEIMKSVEGQAKLGAAERTEGVIHFEKDTNVGAPAMLQTVAVPVVQNPGESNDDSVSNKDNKDTAWLEDAEMHDTTSSTNSNKGSTFMQVEQDGVHSNSNEAGPHVEDTIEHDIKLQDKIKQRHVKHESDIRKNSVTISQGADEKKLKVQGLTMEVTTQQTIDMGVQDHQLQVPHQNIENEDNQLVTSDIADAQCTNIQGSSNLQGAIKGAGERNIKMNVELLSNNQQESTTYEQTTSEDEKVARLYSELSEVLSMSMDSDDQNSIPQSVSTSQVVDFDQSIEIETQEGCTYADANAMLTEHQSLPNVSSSVDQSESAIPNKDHQDDQIADDLLDQQDGKQSQGENMETEDSENLIQGSQIVVKMVSKSNAIYSIRNGQFHHLQVAKLRSLKPT